MVVEVTDLDVKAPGAFEDVDHLPFTIHHLLSESTMSKKNFSSFLTLSVPPAAETGLIW